MRVKSVEFSPCTEEKEKEKRVRRKWKSFNCPSTFTINNNSVDLLTEWREELADEQNINSLLQLSKDLLVFEGQNLGPEEINYRQEQALYWLCKASERGSKEARDKITEMLNLGQGVNESNFEAVYSCSWEGKLSLAQLIGKRLGRKAFRRLELGRGFCTSDQIFRMMQGKDFNSLDAQDVRNRILKCQKISSQDLAEAGSEQMEGKLPKLDGVLSLYRSK